MKARKLGKTGLDISVLSIGTMRLPDDTDESVRIIRKAIDSGCNYIDTARGYKDAEIQLAEALKDGYREKVILSTKWAPWCIKVEKTDDASADCTRKRIDESLKRLQVDRLDFYQLWCVTKPEYFEQAVKKNGMIDGIHKAMKEGLIKHLGITVHDTNENIIRYIETRIFETVTISYNLLNRKVAPVIKRAKELDMGVLIMNTAGGGILVEDTEALQQLITWKKMKLPEVAINFVLATPGITTALSGFSRLSDVEENAEAANNANWTFAQFEKINQELNKIDKKIDKVCTGCKYCMPCKQNINIPDIMKLITKYKPFSLVSHIRKSYTNIVKDKKNAAIDKCIECGECEEKCTQKLPIRENLKWLKEKIH